MKPIDYFDQLDQACEAGAGSLKGDAHAALWLAQRLRRISCLAESGRLARIVPGEAAGERRVFARGIAMYILGNEYYCGKLKNML
jgi:hypothetical protein